jgi:putative hemolysin
MMTLLLCLLLLCFLLCGSALVSGSEVAFFSMSPADLENIKSEENKTNTTILSLLEHHRKLLATILISNNFINIGIVILSDYILQQLIGESALISMGRFICDINPWYEGSTIEDLNRSALSIGRFINFLITIVGVTFILVLFGEVAPKIYANLNNIKFCKLMASPMKMLTIVLNPFSKLLVSWSSRLESNYISRKSGIDDTSKEDLDKAIRLTVYSDDEEADILRGIIKFGNVSAKQIMRSRVDVIAVEVSESYHEVLKVIKESGYSRIPVYREVFDVLVGILYVKDLLQYSQEDDGFEWQFLIRESILYVPESKKIDDLLKEFQQKKMHMGIVVDEFGGSAGIITLEDIMEEVIGEIKGEFDTDEEVDFIKISANNYIFDGKTLLSDVARIIGVDKSTFDNHMQEADSLAGLVLVRLGKIPKKDREISIGQFRLKIVSVTKRRIEKIHLTIL